MTRKELYELVWTKPATDLVETLGVSDVAIMKRCRRLDIPVPGRGHWAKVAAGQSPERPPLPPAPEGEDLHVEFRRVVVDEDSEHITDIERARVAGPTITEITVPDSLSRPHPITSETRDALKGRTLDRYGHACCGWSSGFEVAVNPSSIPRSLLIIDTLVKAAEKYRIRFRREPNGRELRAYVDNSRFATLRLRERATQHNLSAIEIAAEKKKDRYFYHTRRFDPTGKLQLIVSSFMLYGLQSQWEDGKLPLETQLPAVVKGIFQSVESEKVRIERQEESRRQWEEAERRRHNAEERRRKEDESWSALRAEANEWHDVGVITAYFEAVVRHLGSSEDSLPNVVTWLEASKALLNKRNPLIRRIGKP